MATSQLAPQPSRSSFNEPESSSEGLPKITSELLNRLSEARARTAELFEILPLSSFYERPIPERHRLIFYLGHLEAFDGNLLSGPLNLKSDTPDLDRLFAFGIDPVDGNLPTDRQEDWPSIADVEKYNRRIRAQIDKGLQDPDLPRSASPEIRNGTLLNVAIEHRLMHAETLAYLLHSLPADKKIAWPTPGADLRPGPPPRVAQIPAGVATLGRKRAEGFGWDNEFDEQQMDVPGFSIDVFPITNEEYLKFVQSGAYENPKHWAPDDWEWLRAENRKHPHFWRLASGSQSSDPSAQWEYRGMFGNVPLPPSWPVYVTHAEASAYARWAGKKLPSEAQWHRAAYATPEGIEREYPWGNERPDATRGNFHYERWEPNRVDAYPHGVSAFGVQDLLGNGWEWTSTPFAPLNGFEAFSFYPGYSTNFFDGKHYVMKGGSARTDAAMLRRSFRNWFQPHYPFVYTKFRCVEA